MRNLKLLLALMSIWTYGSETLDTLMDNAEYVRFNQVLQCEAISDTVVRCKIAEGVYVQN